MSDPFFFDYYQINSSDGRNSKNSSVTFNRKKANRPDRAFVKEYTTENFYAFRYEFRALKKAYKKTRVVCIPYASKSTFYSHKIVMEFIDGKSLGETRAERGYGWFCANVERFCRILVECFVILHSLKISHLNLSPQHVIIDNIENPRLIGFGKTQSSQFKADVFDFGMMMLSLISYDQSIFMSMASTDTATRVRLLSRGLDGELVPKIVKIIVELSVNEKEAERPSFEEILDILHSPEEYLRKRHTEELSLDIKAHRTIINPIPKDI